MKFCTGLLAAVLSLVALSATAQDGQKIRLATEGAYPPFNEMGTDGKPKGFDVDIGNALCKQMKAECTWVIQDWDGMIPALLANKFDAIVSSMTINDERKMKIAFTSKYYSAYGSLIAARGSSINPSTPATLKGKRIGVQRETAHERYAMEVLAPAGVDVVSYPTADESFLDLANGRIDGTIQDSILGTEAFLKKPAGKNFAFAGDMLKEKKYFGEGQGIGTRKQDQKLVEQFNKALADIRADGTYDKIQKKYFDFDVYSGEL